MSQKRRNHSPVFKAKVALLAIQGDNTLIELSQRYGVHSSVIAKWKKQLQDNSSEIFASGLSADREKEVQSMQRKIGQLTMENDFLAKALGR